MNDRERRARTKLYQAKEARLTIFNLLDQTCDPQVQHILLTAWTQLVKLSHDRERDVRSVESFSATEVT